MFSLVFITRKNLKLQFIFIQVHWKSELNFSSSSFGQKVNWDKFKVHQNSKLLKLTKPWVLKSHKVLPKSDEKQKFFIYNTFFVNKQLTLSFNYLKKYSLNFAQNFRECSFNLAGSESGEKSKRTQFFVYISQLFVYKTRLWT